MLQGRRINPVTAIGALLFLIGGTALTTYLALTIPSRLAAAQGPPEEFRMAATAQAERRAAEAETPPPTPTLVPQAGTAAPTPTLVPTVTPGGTAFTRQDSGAPAPDPSAGGGGDGASGIAAQATQNRFGDWPLPDYVEITYWISIPAIGLEAPIISLAPTEREVDGAAVLRLPVPNSYSVGWDLTSAEPGFQGNTILTGHNNFYGGVFQDLTDLPYGAEIAVWSEYGVFSYYASEILYLEEEGLPLAARLQNAQWLNQTADDRLTIVTCWPLEGSTHRLIVIGTR